MQTRAERLLQMFGRRLLSPYRRIELRHVLFLIRQNQYKTLALGVLRRLRLLAKNQVSNLASSADSILSVELDAKRERLGPDGQKHNKPSFVFPSPTAPILVSVVIPCFNYGKFVGEAVASVLNQTILAREVIVVDDGSNDQHTQDMLRELQHQGDVTVIRQENQGLPSARNSGIALARGEYVCCLDADDTIEPTYLEMAIAVLECDRAAGFAYSWVRLFGDRDEIWRTRDFDFRDALDDNHTSVSAVFRRDDWLAAGGYRPDMREGYEDWEFWLRLAALGRRGKVIRTSLFNHRRHGVTMTAEAHAKRHKLKEYIRTKNRHIICRARAPTKIKGAMLAGEDTNSLAVFRRPGVLAQPDSRPHMLVMMPGLFDGGAEALMLEIAHAVKDEWRLSIVTTLDDEQPLFKAFCAVTSDIVPLHGAFDDGTALDVVAHMIATRGTSVVLSTNCAFLYENVEWIRRMQDRRIAIADILHNDLISGHIRDAVSASHGIDCHILVAPHIEKALVDNGVAQDRIVTIRNGVDVQHFNPDLVDRVQARRAYRFEQDGFVICWVGRLSEEKRPLAYLDIVEELRKRIPVRALLIGSGPLERIVREQIRARNLDDVIYRIERVERAEMAKVYAASDATVMTSSVEGMPFVALESLAMGCPVFATRVGSLDQVIRPGETGALVDKERPSDLVGSLYALGTDAALRSSMRMHARREIFAQGYELERMRAMYRDTFSRLLDRIQPLA